MLEIEIVERGIDEQIRKLDQYDRVSLRHRRNAMQKAVSLVEGEWVKIAPVYKGRYRQSLVGSGRVRSITGSEIIGTVGTNVTHQGVSYPAVLETSDRYHYRSGPRAGQKTAGQVKRVLKRSVKRITGYFKGAIDAIVRELKV